MATWKFVIREKKGVCPIYIRYTHRSGWKNMPTKQKVHSDYWDAENGKLNRFCPQGQRKELAGRLKIWENAIATVIANNTRDGLSLAPADVKAAVIGLVKSNSHSRPSMTVDAAFQQYLAEKTEIRVSTKQVYNAMKNHLDTYCQEKNVPLDWTLFDRRFERLWKAYFLAYKKQDNTVGKYFKTLKTFLYWCSENHYLGSRDYEKYKVYANEIDIYPLTMDELKSIEKFADDKTNDEQDRTIA